MFLKCKISIGEEDIELILIINLSLDIDKEMSMSNTDFITFKTFLDIDTRSFTYFIYTAFCCTFVLHDYKDKMQFLQIKIYDKFPFVCL